MKKDVEKFFTSKAPQRKAAATLSVADKLRKLDSLKVRNEEIKRARPVKSQHRNS